MNTTAAADGSAAWWPMDREACRPSCWSWGNGAQSDQAWPAKAPPHPSRPGTSRAWCVSWGWSARSQRSRVAQTSKRRAKYAVFYYGKPQNNEKVKGILARLGFLKSSQEEATNPRAYDSLWVGRGVDMADVKQLAYAMMQAGIKLKAIRSFDGNGTRKSMTVEIGAHDGSGKDDLKVKSPNCRPLTAEQIDGIVAIDRTTLMCGK